MVTLSPGKASRSSKVWLTLKDPRPGVVMLSLSISTRLEESTRDPDVTEGVGAIDKLVGLEVSEMLEIVSSWSSKGRWKFDSKSVGRTTCEAVVRQANSCDVDMLPSL